MRPASESGSAKSGNEVRGVLALVPSSEHGLRGWSYEKAVGGAALQGDLQDAECERHGLESMVEVILRVRGRGGYPGYQHAATRHLLKVERAQFHRDLALPVLEQLHWTARIALREGVLLNSHVARCRAKAVLELATHRPHALTDSASEHAGEHLACGSQMVDLAAERIRQQEHAVARIAKSAKLHDFARPTQRGHGEAVSERLGERRHVGSHPEHRLRASRM